MLGIVKEEGDIYEVFPPHVDASKIPNLPESPSSGKKLPLKTFSEIEALLKSDRARELKQVLRENCWPTNSTIRSRLWPLLCQQHTTDNPSQDGFYWDMVNQLFGTTELPDIGILLPSFVENQHTQSYHLTKKGIKIADRIVCVLGFACPDITYSPSVYSVTALLLHFMTEEECYNCLANLVASKQRVFITQTKVLFEVTWHTVMQIARKHVKTPAAFLARHCPGSRAERIYMDWIWWVLEGLPFNHLVRVMDCFLHEGVKVLYRMTLAVLILFHKHASNSNSTWAKEIQDGGIDTALMKFCSQIPVSPRKLLRVAFGIRGLSTAYISKVFIKTEMILKSRSVLNGSKRLTRSRSSENLPSSQSQVNIQMMSHTLTIRELFTLWSWLPVRITMYQPVLLYTTEEHGCSLRTFYKLVEQHEPTLLMIKTLNNEVFGAYCSSRWIERNQKDERGNRNAYFGTGETFLFCLSPQRAKYPWVGMDRESVHHSAELFMAADSSMITVGGGEGQAIWMDENVRYGKTERCLTFNNPPLCHSRDFEIKVLEVYGFGSA